jgi:hypothetical protein
MGKYKVKVLERESRDNLVVNAKAIKTDKPPRPRQAPAWFKDFVANEFRPLVAKVDNIDTRVGRLETRMDSLETKVDKIEAVLNGHTSSINSINDVLERNNLH